MPRKFDFDRYLREFHALTPSERDAIVRLVTREAKVERTEALREMLHALRRQSRAGLARAFNVLRPVGATVSGAVATAWRRYRQRRSVRNTATQLYAMDDRELKDIGLRRGDIDFVLSGLKDPTRRPRTAGSQREEFRAIDYASPSLEPTQRAGAPLVLRKECAG